MHYFCFTPRTTAGSQTNIPFIKCLHNHEESGWRCFHMATNNKGFLHGYKQQKLEIVCTARSLPQASQLVPLFTHASFQGETCQAWSTWSQGQPQQIPAEINVTIPLSSSFKGSGDSPEQSPSACCHPVHRSSSNSLSSSALKEDRILFLYTCRKLICKLQKLKPPYHYIMPPIKVTGSSFIFIPANVTFLKKPLTLLAFVLFFPLEGPHLS